MKWASNGLRNRFDAVSFFNQMRLWLLVNSIKDIKEDFSFTEGKKNVRISNAHWPIFPLCVAHWWPSSVIPGGEFKQMQVWKCINLTVSVKVPIGKHAIASTGNPGSIRAELRRKIIWIRRIRNPQVLVKSNSNT